MKDNLLNSYVSSHLKSLERDLSAYAKNQKPETLHLLRVDVKKIRAAFSFADDIYSLPDKPDQVKPLFRDAGKIRELQINQRIIKNLPHPPGLFLSQLGKKEKAQEQRFVKKVPEYLKRVEKFRNEFSLPHSLPKKKTIKKYFKKQVQKANKWSGDQNRNT